MFKTSREAANRPSATLEVLHPQAKNLRNNRLYLYRVKQPKPTTNCDLLPYTEHPAAQPWIELIRPSRPKQTLGVIITLKTPLQMWWHRIDQQPCTTRSSLCFTACENCTLNKTSLPALSSSRLSLLMWLRKCQELLPAAIKYLHASSRAFCRR